MWKRKERILPANLPALEPAASVSSTNQTASYFHFSQARTWIFHDFFHICMFSTPQNFHFFPLLFAFPHFHIFSAFILWKGNVPACKEKPAFPQTHILYYYYTFSYFYFFSSFFCKQKSGCPPVENAPSIKANEKRTKYQTRLRFASCNAGTSERGFAP